MRIYRWRVVLGFLGVMLTPFSLVLAQVDESQSAQEAQVFVETTLLYAAEDRATSQEIAIVALSEEEKKYIKREDRLAIWKPKQEVKWENMHKRAGETFTINATAYTASADECGWATGITASGVMVKENRTLACPPEYPFGVKVEIDGMGTYTCEDRGGAIKGNHFDIYMETKKEAFAFGRRHLEARIVM